MLILYFNIKSQLISSSLKKLLKIKKLFIKSYYNDLLKKELNYNNKLQNIFYNIIKTHIQIICQNKKINSLNIYIKNFTIQLKGINLKNRYQSKGRCILIQRKQSSILGHYSYSF